MEDARKTRKLAGPLRDRLSPGLQDVLKPANEETPERLVRLARQLQAAIDKKRQPKKH